METASCSSCKRAIIWTISPAGARLPLDARPVTVYGIDPTESMKVEGLPRAVRARSVYSADAMLDLPGPIYISHFLSCPNARDFSRGGGT